MDWDHGLVIEIWDQEREFGFGTKIEDWNWGFGSENRMGIRNRGLDFGIGDQGLGVGIGDWDWGIGH